VCVCVCVALTEQENFFCVTNNVHVLCLCPVTKILFDGVVWLVPRKNDKNCSWQSQWTWTWPLVVAGRLNEKVQTSKSPVWWLQEVCPVWVNLALLFLVKSCLCV